MSESPEQKRFPITIIRLPTKEATREQVFTSPQWLDVLEAIVNHPNWRFLLNAQETGSSKLDVLIGWKANTDHPASFLLQDETLDTLLSPIYEFCGSDKPQIINLYRLDKAMDCYALRVERPRGEHRIMEALTVRGPSENVEQTMAEIQDALARYTNRQSNSIGCWDHGYRKHALCITPYTFKEVDGTTADSEHSDGQVAITLFIHWSDLLGRSEFQNPEIEDRAVPESARKYLCGDFWETCVAARLRALEEKGASITSWDYENVKVGVSRDGEATTRRRDRIW